MERINVLGFPVLFTVLVFSLTFVTFLNAEVKKVETGEKNGKVEIFIVKTGKTQLMDKVVKSDEEWRKLLTKDQYRITRKKGTESAFTGEYYDLKEKGIYKCVACGTDLFSSDTKYDSGTGWPSFYEPVSEHNIYKEEDRSFFTVRTEVLCRRCDSHLGHVFDDGPAPTYKRYCINSLALRFEKSE